MKTLNLTLEFTDNKYAVLRKLANIFYPPDPENPFETKNPIDRYIEEIVEKMVKADIEALYTLPDELMDDWIDGGPKGEGEGHNYKLVETKTKRGKKENGQT